jgi:hypothetical protein
MIASQFLLDDRLAELRQAGEDPRVPQARAATSQPDARTTRLGDALRSLFGGSTTPSRPAGFAAH